MRIEFIYEKIESKLMFEKVFGSLGTFCCLVGDLVFGGLVERRMPSEDLHFSGTMAPNISIYFYVNILSIWNVWKSKNALTLYGRGCN